jgi:hypothetical protein
MEKVKEFDDGAIIYLTDWKFKKCREEWKSLLIQTPLGVIDLIDF